MAQIVIVGAGLTGISAAYHLEREHFTDYLMFEKEQQPGGLCRSIMQDGFTFDYTGHLLHINDPYFKSLIETYVGFENMNTIHRRSYIYSQETYTPYPFQIHLFGLPKETIIECILGYVNRPKIDHALMFHDWVTTNFGKGFGDYFFFPYQHKIFSVPIDELTASWTSRFVPSTSLEQILHGAFAQIPESVGYNAQFFYPKQGGIFSWVKNIAQQIQKPIQADYCVELIDLKKKYIRFTNGHIQKYEKLITTMPLDILLSCIVEPPSAHIKQAQNKLRCNKVINFNLGINRADLSDKHWIYFPEEKYPFYRLGFGHNFSEHMAPANCSSLYGEFSYLDQDQAWVKNTLSNAISQTKKLLAISDDEIMTECVIPINHAYVIFDQWRDAHLPALLASLEAYDVYSIGRYGAWKYASMQEGILDGKEIVEKLLRPPLPIPLHHKELMK